VDLPLTKIAFGVTLKKSPETGGVKESARYTKVCREEDCPDHSGRVRHRKIFGAVRALVTQDERIQGTGTGELLENMADFGARPCWGSRPWNSMIARSNVSTAAQSSCLQQANKSFSTISNSRTIPNTASSARRGAPGETRGYVLRHARHAQSAARRQLSRSSQLRAGRSCADPASRNRASNRRRNLLRPTTKCATNGRTDANVHDNS
jgi:hypothetical protein